MSIQILNLNKEYINSTKMKVHVLKDISMSIKEGEFVAVMGRSGSGKSTFLKILGGLEAITSGTVLFQDKDISKLTRKEIDLHRSETIGFVFQDFGLMDALTVEENIMLPLTLNKTAGQKAEAEVSKMISYMEIEHIKNSYTKEISGGEQQRASICRALVKEPNIILADEPTGNLDYQSSTIILQMLSKINDEQKKTIIMVTHDEYSASFCDRVILFHDGKNVKEIYRDCNQCEFENKIAVNMRTLRHGGDTFAV